MRKHLAVMMDVSDDETFNDVIEILNRVLPYVADNVVVLEPQAEKDNDGQLVLYTNTGA